MLVLATGQFGVPKVKACTQARRELGSVVYRTFPECFKCVGAFGRPQR
jgi:hypothetical protein